MDVEIIGQMSKAVPGFRLARRSGTGKLNNYRDEKICFRPEQLKRGDSWYMLGRKEGGMIGAPGVELGGRNRNEYLQPEWTSEVVVYLRGYKSGPVTQ